MRTDYSHQCNNKSKLGDIEISKVPPKHTAPSTVIYNNPFSLS